MTYTFKPKSGRWYVNGKAMPYGVRPSQDMRNRQACSDALFGIVTRRQATSVKP